MLFSPAPVGQTAITACVCMLIGQEDTYSSAWVEEELAIIYLDLLVVALCR